MAMMARGSPYVSASNSSASLTSSAAAAASQLPEGESEVERQAVELFARGELTRAAELLLEAV